VEQGTHFIDLARYLCGEVDAATIHGIAIGADDASGLGRLAAIPASVQEETIPGVDRIPRASVTSWRFENGGLGVLNHALLLQGHAYENAITIWADGLSIEWLAPYTPQTRLLVRVGGSDETVTVTFEGDDMYRSEDCAFLDAVTTAKASRTRKAATPRGAVSASTAALPLTLSPAGGSQPGSGAAAAAAEGPATGKEGALSAADDCSCHTAACASCQGRILSSFEDATRTYMLSCQLRDSLQLGAQAAAGKAQAAGSS
jgi:predicted dehydrogenase